jgi:hypothetical protein
MARPVMAAEKAAVVAKSIREAESAGFTGASAAKQRKVLPRDEPGPAKGSRVY